MEAIEYRSNMELESNNIITWDSFELQTIREMKPNDNEMCCLSLLRLLSSSRSDPFWSSNPQAVPFDRVIYNILKICVTDSAQ